MTVDSLFKRLLKERLPALRASDLQQYIMLRVDWLPAGWSVSHMIMINSRGWIDIKEWDWVDETWWMLREKLQNEDEVVDAVKHAIDNGPRHARPTNRP